MIKVINILTDSNIGGAGRCLVNYLKYCDRSRFDVKVILPKGSLLIPEVLALDTPVIEVDGIAERSFSVKAIGTLRKILRQERPHIVHTHGSFSGRIAGRLCGCRIIYTRHSAFPVPERLKKGPLHLLNGAVNSYFADSIIAVSPATARNLTESGVPKEKITVMMNGAAPVTPSPAEVRSATRKQLGIPDGVFTAGILARLEPYKGHGILLEAARELSRQGRDFRILICGGGSEEAGIKAGIQSLGLSDKVLFLGFVSNVSDILSILDVQLNCSYGTEASSLALIEGMSIGLATIASDYGGNPWQIDDGVTGLLFQSRNASQLAAKIAKLMDEPELLRQIRQNALNTYRSRFTGEIFAQNIEKLYTQTLK